MKNQVKGDWWKTVFTTVIVALIVLLCGSCIFQCIMTSVTQRLGRSPKLVVREPGCNIPMSDAHTLS